MTLEVTGCVPYGNVCDVVVRDEGGLARVEFASSSHGGPESLWFCFRILRDDTKTPGPQKMKLVWKHVGNVLGGQRAERMRPVVRFADRDWERLGPPDVETLPDGRQQPSWVIESPERHVDVAFCYPYGRPELDALVKESKGYWRADTIGTSQASRPLIRLSNDFGREGSDRPGLYLVARQHSGETPGSWALDGFLRQVAKAGEGAPLVWTVPLTNIDGIEQGDYGKDNYPYDLNRAWHHQSMRHEVLVMMRDMDRWAKRCRPTLGIDFHAPGGDENPGVYAFLSQEDTLPFMFRESMGWCDAIEDALKPKYASARFARSMRYLSRWNTPGFASYCMKQHRMAALSVETPYGMAGELVLTRERYREIGARMAKAVLERIKTDRT